MTVGRLDRIKDRYTYKTHWFIAKVECKDKDIIMLRDGRPWIKNTGYPANEVKLMFPTQDNIDMFRSEVGDGALLKLDAALEEMESLRASLGETLVELETSRGHAMGLERRLDESLSTTKMMRSELISMRNTHEDDECRLGHMTRDIDDLESTVDHMQSELRRMSSVNVKGIVASMLEYVAAMDNIIGGCGEHASFTDVAQARRQKLMMDLENHGLTVHAPVRGKPMGDGRMDIREQHTEEPSKDGTVARVNRYGFSFRNDVYPGEAPSITVYRYDGDATDSDIASELNPGVDPES